MADVTSLRLYPTPKQAKALFHALDTTRDFYNSALGERKAANLKGMRVTTLTQSKRLTAKRRDDPDLSAVDRRCLQSALRLIDVATMKMKCLPPYRGAKEWSELIFSTGIKKHDNAVRVPKVGKVRCPGVRDISEVGSARVFYDGKHWHLRLKNASQKSVI